MNRTEHAHTPALSSYYLCNNVVWKEDRANLVSGRAYRSACRPSRNAGKELHTHPTAHAGELQEAAQACPHSEGNALVFPSFVFNTQLTVIGSLKISSRQKSSNESETSILHTSCNNTLTAGYYNTFEKVHSLDTYSTSQVVSSQKQPPCCFKHARLACRPSKTIIG